MNIELNEFALAKNEYFKLVTLNYFRTRWWVYAILFVIAALYFFNLFYNKKPLGGIDLLFLVFVLILPAYYVFRFWSYTNSKNNAGLYSSKKMSMDGQSLKIGFPDEEPEEIPWEAFIKASVTRDFYMLDLSRTQFILVPRKAFRSREDETVFADFIKGRGLVNPRRF